MGKLYVKRNLVTGGSMWVRKSVLVNMVLINRWLVSVANPNKKKQRFYSATNIVNATGISRTAVDKAINVDCEINRPKSRLFKRKATKYFKKDGQLQVMNGVSFGKVV